MNQVEMTAFAGDPDFMMSLARGLVVMQLVVSADRSITLADVTRRSGLSRAASRRCLYTLCQLGYVEHGERGYSACHDVLRLGRGFLAPNSLAVRAQPLLDALRDECRESCSIGILDKDHIRYIARAEAARIISINIRVGSRLPLYATSMGRVLLAGLSAAQRDNYLGRVELKRFTNSTIVEKGVLAETLRQVERDGYAIVDQELEWGLRSASVPIYEKGSVIAALNIATPVARVSLDELQARFLPALKEASALISRSADCC